VARGKRRDQKKKQRGERVYQEVGKVKKTIAISGEDGTPHAEKERARVKPLNRTLQCRTKHRRKKVVAIKGERRENVIGGMDRIGGVFGRRRIPS